jgi:thiol-disulfide isomerase/thioredoxin
MPAHLFRSTIVALTAAGATFLAAGHVVAQPEPRPAAHAAEREAEVTPEARRVLDRLSRFYQDLPGASVHATFSVTTPDPDGGPPNERRTELSMAAADPNRFVFPLAGGGEFSQFRIVSTGEKLYMYYGEPLNKYVEREAPENMEAVIDAMSMGERPDLASFTSPIFPFLKLMGGSPLERIEGAQRIELVGEEELDGVAHERLRIIGEQLDVDVWVRAGEQAWITQIRPDAGKGLEELGEIGKALEAQMPKVVLLFNRWEQQASFPEGTFVFTPPAGAERVESLVEAMRERQGGPGEPERAHSALVGKAAPALNLEMLGGGKADLSAAGGKVVMLDFWATWCPPCVRGLPVMSRLSEQYKDRGLVFYAVNVQEDERTVRRFLERQKLAIPVAMDKDGSAGERYGVTGIPQTVLIGKDGTVQAVHVGFTSEMEKELSEQIEKLLKGEKLTGSR